MSGSKPTTFLQRKHKVVWRLEKNQKTGRVLFSATRSCVNVQTQTYRFMDGPLFRGQPKTGNIVVKQTLSSQPEWPLSRSLFRLVPYPSPSFFRFFARYQGFLPGYTIPAARWRVVFKGRGFRGRRDGEANETAGMVIVRWKNNQLAQHVERNHKCGCAHCCHERYEGDEAHKRGCWTHRNLMGGNSRGRVAPLR